MKPQVIIFNSGTGISQRDTTYDVLARKLDKTIPGFGELFRMLSWDQIGAAAMMSRATAGVYRGTVVFFDTGITQSGATGMAEANCAGVAARCLGSVALESIKQSVSIAIKPDRLMQ